ncbi:hypothetical protein O1L68_30325 [Streptomyces lydicus]|nr:hypothetical protein [Streptomyces lydicus]
MPTAASRMTPRGLPLAVPWAASLYVGAVQLGAYATARLPRHRRTELLRAHSTNVTNLRAGKWQTLVTSAAFVEEPLPVAYGAALLAALGTAEARWGPWRTAGVFAAGHVGASLLVYAALRGRSPGGAPGAPGAPCARPTGAGDCAVPAPRPRERRRRTRPPGPSTSEPATASTPRWAPSPPPSRTVARAPRPRPVCWHWGPGPCCAAGGRSPTPGIWPRSRSGWRWGRGYGP